MLGTSFRKNYHHIDQIFPRAFLNYLFWNDFDSQFSFHDTKEALQLTFWWFVTIVDFGASNLKALKTEQKRSLAFNESSY